jgi:hypothetical protein
MCGEGEEEGRVLEDEDGEDRDGTLAPDQVPLPVTEKGLIATREV